MEVIYEQYEKDLNIWYGKRKIYETKEELIKNAIDKERNIITIEDYATGTDLFMGFDGECNSCSIYHIINSGNYLSRSVDVWNIIDFVYEDQLKVKEKELQKFLYPIVGDVSYIISLYAITPEPDFILNVVPDDTYYEYITGKLREEHFIHVPSGLTIPTGSLNDCRLFIKCVDRNYPDVEYKIKMMRTCLSGQGRAHMSDSWNDNKPIIQDLVTGEKYYLYDRSLHKVKSTCVYKHN